MIARNIWVFKIFFSIIGMFYLLSFSSFLYGETIKQAVVEVINTNPSLKENLRDYRATQQNLNLIESQYYPSIDIHASFGINNSSGFLSDTNISDDGSYSSVESSITLTQNLFNGFATTNKIDYEEANILVSAYKYLEKSNELTFDIVRSYIDVLRFDELLKIAVKDVQMNEITYQKIENLFEANMITLSEIKKIEATLAHSKSNLVIHLKKLRDAKFRYRRVAGRMPNIETMRKPDYNIAIPTSSQVTALYAINHNPTLLVNRYKVKAIQALRKKNKKGFYPTIDFQVTQRYSDSSRDNIYDIPDDRFEAKVVLNYNLFRGGADSAESQKYVSLIDKEIERGRSLKRKIIEDVDIAWDSYDMTNAQLKDLREYAFSSKEAFTLYQEEFSQGSRSLVELLLIQKDVTEAESSVIEAEYDSLLAKYTILNATGELFLQIVGDKDFTSRVNLFTENRGRVILDSELVKFDVDGDNISDNQDLCDNSVLENNIMLYGCKKIDKFSSKMKEIIEYKKHNKIVLPKVKKVKSVKKRKIVIKQEPIKKKVKIIKKKKSKKRKKVIKKPDIIETSFIEENSISRADLFKDDTLIDNYSMPLQEQQKFIDGCIDVPQGYNLDRDGCATSVTITLSPNFEKIGTTIPKNIRKKLSELASFMKKNESLMAHIVGYSSRTPVSSYKYNMKISQERANRVRNELIKKDVFSYRLSSEGKGYRDPIADNSTKSGRDRNRRVEVIFSR